MDTQNPEDAFTSLIAGEITLELERRFEAEAKRRLIMGESTDINDIVETVMKKFIAECVEAYGGK
jgi:hypothetical protein